MTNAGQITFGSKNKKHNFLYHQLETEELLISNFDDDENFEPEEQRILICGVRRKSRRWITTVGAAIAIIIISLTVGIVIWQTHKSSESETIIPETDDSYGMYNNAAVSCDAPRCSEIGKSMLERNGSVADAAIAALLCMGVIHSQSMGIGGGFLMVMYNASQSKAYVLNARETAPAKATEDMFDGNANKSQVGGLAVGIPGEIMGYWQLHQRAGILPWKELFEPTIKLCNEGFQVTKHTAGALKSSEARIKNEPSLTEIFIDKSTGNVFEENDTIYRKQLGKILRLIADANNGAEEFYEGQVAKWLIEDLNEFDGIITLDDLKNYRADWLEPIEIKLQGNYTIHGVPPPGSGVLMGFIMKVLDNYLLSPSSINSVANSVTTYQRITEAFKHTFAKRTHLGDPFDDVADLVNEFVKNMTSDAYVEDIRSKIHDDSTNNTYEYYGAEYYQPDDHGTAHISIYGSNGDAIAITSTVNLYFGAKIRSKQTGIIFNDEMDDFSAPNITNYFGVPPSPNNFIKPGKRPMSSMTPAIITNQKGEVRLVIGTAGGTKITTATALVAIRNLWFDENIKTAIDAPRIHHQLYPMKLQYEKGFSDDYVKQLEKMEHETEYLNIAGSVTCGIARYENGTIFANSDFRKGGSVAGY